MGEKKPHMSYKEAEEYYSALPKLKTRYKVIEVTEEDYNFWDLIGATVIWQDNIGSSKSIGVVQYSGDELIVVWKDCPEDTIIDSEHGREVLLNCRIFLG